MKYVLAFALVALLVVGCKDKDRTEPATPVDPGPPTGEPIDDVPKPIPEPVVVFDVEVVKSTADYWDPAVFDVTYTVDGIPQPVEVELAEGYYFETEGGIEVFSNGQLGDHSILINDEEYRVRFEDMPVCAGTREGTVVIDCQGLQQGSGTPWYIYYGEDDERIVEWDVVYVGQQDGEEYAQEPEARLQAEAEKMIGWTNEKFKRSGVFVRLRLVQVIGTPNANGSWDPQRLPEGRLVDSDILAIKGRLPEGICGYAGKVNKFRNRVSPLRPLSGCGPWAFAHELGHSVGLGHGYNGGGNSSIGSTFFKFAQGSGFCGSLSGIMQYGGSDSSRFFSNHKMTCNEMRQTDRYDEGEMAGSLSGGSTAYAINRVRYDVALVHDEFAKEPVAFVEEVCSKTRHPDGTATDCYGHNYGSASQSLTWYGEDDLRVATIQLGLIRNDRSKPKRSPIPEGHADLLEFQHWLDQINASNLDSDVRIRFVSVGGKYGSFFGVAGVDRNAFKGEADIVVGWGPGGNQGEAYIQRSFLPNQTPPALQTTGSWTLLRHELGHVMGLGHGDWGAGEIEPGSFFLDFGHGWQRRRVGESICSSVDSVMSYGNSELGWSNSLLSCSQAQKNPGAFGDARGLRGPNGTDEAYALNRVRWNVSRVAP